MKSFTKLSIVLLSLLAFNMSTAQTTPLKITVDWEAESYKNKVEIYDQANNLVYTICNTDYCFQTTGPLLEEIYTGTYDLGCVQDGTYYLKLYNADGAATSWASGYVTVEMNGVVPTGFPNTGGVVNDETQYPFTVTSDGTPCDSLTDTDGDGVIDSIDIDDDNDGIHDVDEGLGIDVFNCTIPALNFKDHVLDTPPITAGQVGAIYRFPNAIFLEPYDVLMEITEMHDATLSNIDRDDTDNFNYLQTEVTFTGNDTPPSDACPTCVDYPGITFKFTIVDTGTSDPATTLFSIGGTTWDIDGGTTYRESVRYYNPSAYGVDNPTTVQVTDVSVLGDKSEIEMTAGGILEGPGFSTLPQLRAYFQFRLDNTDADPTNNSFSLRMQNVRTTYTSTSTRQYGMSFTQCDVLDFKSASIIIVNGEDTDGDGLDNQIDIDSDNDGIPDNIEGQPTVGYIIPDFNNMPYVNIDPITGADTAYDFEFDLPDTDGDGTPDFLDLDSDGDGKLDIEENGSTSNLIVLFNDPDSDGLDFLFDDVTATYDINDEITSGTLAELIASFLDTDTDVLTGGDLDYRDASDFGAATIDFDGVNDYVDSDQILGGYTNASIMAWVKLNTAFNADGFVVGQDNFNLYIKYGALNTNTLVAVVNGVSAEVTTTNLSVDKWVHVAAVYANGDLKIYVNGEEELNTSLSVALNTSTDNFTIGKNPNDSQLFKGAIDEVRVFDVRLTENQLQQMVFQEIEQNGLNVQGTIVPLDISNFAPSSEVPWANLQAYYPMTNVVNTKTLDYSDYNRNAILHNIETIQPQTAPMPYETIVPEPDPDAELVWESTSTWLNGDVWDIENNLSFVKPWAIFTVKSNVTNSTGIKSYGLIIENDKTLTISGDNAGADYEVNNGWYFELNGTLDLLGDSQLIQGVNSDLVTDTDGKILRRQEGNLNYYWYNYWSSPVGALAATTNTNTNFSINMLKDGPEDLDTVEFTSAYNEENKISNRWLYKFQNGRTYNDWITLATNSTIEPGVGYTHKGTSNAIGDQQYIFEGKPNNGTITLTADDVDGDSADESLNESPNFNYTSTLIGNPYPSAIDARLFIKDNGPEDPLVLDGSEVISGTVYVWEQWSGSSHNLDAYEGGYGTINYSATAPAYQWNNPGLDVTLLAKTPTFFIPVAQGFFVEVIADLDNIEFNNSQRVFVKESDYSDLDPESGSSFFRTNQQDASTQTTEDQIGSIRLELNVSNGNQRSFVLAFSESATDGYDYGYDARTIDPQEDDLSSYLDGKKMIIQTFAPIEKDKVVDLVFNSTGSYNYTIEMVGINNIPEDQEIYLRDNLTNTNFDLRSGEYSFSSEINAEDTERFDIVFKPGETLSNDDFDTNNTLIYVNNTEDKLYVKGLIAQAKQLSLTNILGQTIKTYNNINNQTLESGINISNLSSGVYIISVTNDSNQTIDKKVIIN